MQDDFFSLRHLLLIDGANELLSQNAPGIDLMRFDLLAVILLQHLASAKIDPHNLVVLLKTATVVIVLLALKIQASVALVIVVIVIIYGEFIIKLLRLRLLLRRIDIPKILHLHFLVIIRQRLIEGVALFDGTGRGEVIHRT